MHSRDPSNGAQFDRIQIKRGPGCSFTGKFDLAYFTGKFTSNYRKLPKN
jgi:hypothetical protein